MRAQVSFEYLVIISITTLLLIPTLYIFYQHTQGSNEQVAASRLNSLGEDLLKQVNTIYYTGQDAKTTISFNMPDNVENISIELNKIIMIVLVDGKPHELVYFSDINLSNGSCTTPVYFNENFLRPGIKEVSVESCGNFVTIYPQ